MTAAAEVRRVLWESARDAGFRDVHFSIQAVAHREEDLPRLEASLTACFEAMAEIAGRIGPGG